MTRSKLMAYKYIKGTIESAPLHTKSRTWTHIRKYFSCNRLFGKPQTKDWWHTKKRKIRKDRIPDKVKERVREFLLSPDISREVPAKSEAMKIKGADGEVQLLAKHTMVFTIEEAFRQYKEIFPDDKIGLTSFRALAPPNLKKVAETSRRTCLCSSCCNVALKLEALKKFIRSTNNDAPIENADDLLTLTKSSFSKMLLCPYDRYPSMKCLNQECNACSSKFDDVLSPLKDNQDASIGWYHWEYIVITKNDSTKKIMSCVQKTTTLITFLDCLKADMKLWPSHIFRASWQHNQMSTSISSLTPGQVVILMDYSENYRCLFRDEVQSGFFDQQQVTIHPCMTYYKSQPEGTLVKHAIIGVSPDSRHDSFLTHAFEDKVISVLKDQQDTATLTKIIEWTDGCSAQYKCKKSIFDISRRAHNFEFHRNYFETSHGKSPCDGLGSVVKNTCIRAVTAGQVLIDGPLSLFDFCQRKLAHGPQVKNRSEGKEISKWDFIFVDKVVRISTDNIKPLKGIRKLHQVVSAQPYHIHTRFISCYCSSCNNRSGPCENSSWVDKPTLVKIDG